MEGEKAQDHEGPCPVQKGPGASWMVWRRGTFADLPLSLLQVGERQDLSLSLQADTCLTGEGQHTQRETMATS